MIKEAELNAEPDAKKKKEVETLNKAEQVVYSIDKTIEDVKEHITDEEKETLLKKKEELETLVNAEEKDYDAIEAKDKEIEEFIQPIVMKMYEAAQQAQQAAQGAENAQGEATDSKDDVIDAEFEEK